MVPEVQHMNTTRRALSRLQSVLWKPLGPYRNHAMEGSYKVKAQAVVVRVDLAEQMLQGYTDITLLLQSTALAQVSLHCRQCAVSSVQVLDHADGNAVNAPFKQVDHFREVSPLPPTLSPLFVRPIRARGLRVRWCLSRSRRRC